MKTRYFTNDAFAIVLLIYGVCIGIAVLCVVGF